MATAEAQVVNENNFGPPPIDLPTPSSSAAPPPASLFEPAQPMPTPPIPAISPQVKRGLAHGGPVTQDTTIRQTFYPGGGAGINPVGLPGTDRKASGCIQFLAKVFNGEVPESSEYFIRVDRVGPAMWDGQRLPLGPIESRMPVQPYPDLHENIRSIHGGGEYQLRVFDAEGRQQHQMKFSVDVLRDPPNSRLPGMPGYAPAVTSGYRTSGALGAINQEAQEDVVKLRTEEQRLRAQKTTLLEAASLEETEYKVEQNRRQRRDSEERRTMGPQVETLRTEMNATIKDLIRDNQLQQERMLHTIKELMVSTKPPQDNGSALMMAETMKAMTAMVAAVITGTNKPAQNNELSEAIKMTQAANEKVVTMAIQSATAQAGKNDALITQLITNRLEHPDTAVKQALEMRESGWQQAMQMVQMMENMRGDHDEQVINPEGGFLGNLGNVLLSALNGLMSGGGKGGGSKILDVIAQNLGKQPNQLSQQDLRYAAQRMEQAQRSQLPVLQPMAALPAPQQQQPQPQQQPRRVAPAQPSVSSGTTGMFDAIYETVDASAMQPDQQFQVWPMPIPVEALRPTPQETFAVLQGHETVAEMTVEPVVSQVPGAATAQMPSEGLDHLVGEAVQIALEDITSERRVHDWVEFAVDKWPRDFLRRIAQAPNDEERLKLIQHHCTPSLFKQFFDLVTDLNKQNRYINFMTNLRALVEEVNKEAVGA